VKVPPELVGDWLTEAADLHLLTPTNLDYLANRAAQWGADQELEACCEWLGGSGYAGTGSVLRAARRPKPPTLAEQGIEELELLKGDANSMGMGFDAPSIRAALNRLAELEAQQ
jgi:hypothetical protein